MKNLVSLEDALSHLNDRIPDTACKKIITDLVEFIIDWNNHRSIDNKVFTFIRESKNIAFALDRGKNKENDRRPNFLVIKLAGTDREFKGLHADFDLGSRSSPPPSELLQYLSLRPSRRESNLPRWIAVCSDIYKMGFGNFQKLFIIAYEKKGGVI